MIYRVLVCLVVCLAATGIAAGDDARKEYVKVPADLENYLFEDSAEKGKLAGMSARVPIVSAIEGQSARVAAASIVSMEQVEGARSVVTSDFNVGWSNPENEDRFAYLTFSTSKTREIRPGDYRFIVHVRFAKPDDTFQTINVLLKRAPPVIGVGSTVVIRQTNRRGGLETIAGELRVREDSGRADLRDVTVVAVPDQANTKKTTARVYFDAAKFDVVRSTTKPVTPRVNGVFPLGTSKGTIEVSSPDLAEVKIVPYEVRVSRSTAWIIWAILIGLVLGLIFRVLVKKIRDRLAASLEKTRVIAAVQQFQRGIRDAAFNERARLILGEINRKRRWYRVAQEVEATGKGKETLDKLVEEFRKFHEEETGKSRELARLLGRPWCLPKAAELELATARKAIADVMELVNVKDPTSARTARQKVVDGELLATVNASLLWHVRLVDYFRELALHPPPLLDEDRTGLESFFEAMAETRPKSPAVAQASIEQATGILEATHSRYTMLEIDVARLRHDLEEFLDHGIAALVPDNRFRGEVAELRQQTLDLSTEIENDLKADVDRSSNPVRLHAGAGEFWAEFIVAVRPDNRLPVDSAEFMAGGLWEKAIKAAQRSPEVREIAAIAADDIGGPPLFPQTRGLGMPRLVSADASRERVVVLRDPQKEQEKLQDRIERIGWAQTVLLALVLIVIASFYYGDNWVGENKEVATLILLAFSVDLTADGVIKFFKI